MLNYSSEKNIFNLSYFGEGLWTITSFQVHDCTPYIHHNDLVNTSPVIRIRRVYRIRFRKIRYKRKRCKNTIFEEREYVVQSRVCRIALFF